jgi:acyl carrier protein
MTSESARARAIEDWLVFRVAAALDVPAAQIDARGPLSRHGLGSIEALAVMGDLEEWLGFTLDPALIWDYPTIAGLALYLGQEEVAAAGAPGDAA